MPSSSPSRESILAAIASLDFTSLSPATDTDESITEVCRQATSGPCPCAAVCVLPKFVTLAKKILEGTAVKVATVVNFPEGAHSEDVVRKECERALQDGVDEIDVVWNWRKFTYGDENGALAPVRVVCEAVAGRPAASRVIVKVILETAALESDSVYDAAHLVLHRLCGYGEDSSTAEDGHEHDPECTSPFSESARRHVRFLKTSTGQLKLSEPLGNGTQSAVMYENVVTGATPEAVRALVTAINDTGASSVGVKVSGGVRTVEDATAYLDMVRTGLAGTFDGRFRIGASNVHGKLVAVVRGSSG